MSHIQFLLCLFGIIASFFLNDADARLARLPTEGIIGGNHAARGQFPYQVSLQTRGISFCGGSILTERFILTAAHCVVENDNSFTGDSITVVAGTHNLNSKSDRIAIDVVKVFVPKEYDRARRKAGKFPIGDIAILKLKEDLLISGNSKLGEVKLPKKRTTYEGKRATISGFGYNKIDLVIDPKTGEYKEVNGIGLDEMRFAETTVYSYEKCRKIFAPFKIKKSHICARIIQRDKKHPEGACTGDSGGPLVYDGIQIGVLSTSPFGCREHVTSGLYTRVTDYLDFIDKVVKDKIDKKIRTTLLEVSE